MPGTTMRAEIAEQPDVLRRVLDHRDEIRALGERLAASGPRAVTFLARGTSDHAALYGKYLVETLCGIPAGSFSPSVITVYGARPDFSSTLLIAVSQSGGSPDIVQSLRVARQRGAVTVAIVNDPASDLALAAEFVVNVRAGRERAVAATKSYVAELLTLHQLIHAMAGILDDGADALPDIAAELIASTDVSEMVASLADRDRIAVVGRGYSLPSALECALKLMETSYISAQGFSTADFQHGPVAMLGPGMPLLIFSTALDFPRQLAQRARDAGAGLLVIGGAPRGAGVVASIPSRIAPPLRPIIEIIPAQLLALNLSRLRGNDPDHPRGLLKATATL